jgi:hypothetical protein
MDRRQLRSAKDVQRPYRIWDAGAKCDLRWRYYAVLRNAMNAALVEVRWAEVSVSYEVYDSRTSELHGVYTRLLNGIRVATK